jgi:CBS domain containing-hemolysin-like protein
MSALAWIVASGGAVFAAISAAADGALLADSPTLSLAERTGIMPESGARPRSDRERAHRALSFGRVLGHGLAGGGIALALGLDESATASTVLMLILAGLITVMVAESIARAIGDALGEHVWERLHGFTVFVQRIFAPIVHLGERLERAFAVVLPAAEQSIERREEAAAQFREVVSAEPDVSGDERDLLLGVFSFGETTADEVMVPRVDIVAIDHETNWSEMVDRVRSARHSRMPVFEESIDEIVGILYAKDLLASVIADQEPAGGWQSLVRPVAFIPGSKRIADLLREFRASRRHIAIVADEYGGTAGLVTIEDVLEELVGEIRDEYDDEERQIETEEGQRYWVNGRLTLSDLSEMLGYDFTRDDVTTIGGLVLEVLGRVPRAGESLTIGPYRVIVERVVRRKIERIYLEPLEPATDSDEESD